MPRPIPPHIADNGSRFSFLQKTKVWLGTAAGVAICLVVGCGLIGAFYSLKKNYWGGAEDLYEGIFSLLASIIITVMGFALLRISKMQAKWRVKIQEAMSSSAAPGAAAGGRLKIWSRKYAFFILPFITVLREGLEVVVFVGGISLAEPASAFPLPVITALLAGSLVGVAVYKGGNRTALHWFLIGSTCILYLVASGLFSRAAWNFDMYQVCAPPRSSVKPRNCRTGFNEKGAGRRTVCKACRRRCGRDGRRARKLRYP